MGRLFQKTPFFFAVAVIFFAAIQAIGTIPDPDTFYHAKMAVFLSRGEIVRDFVWLPFTTWADRFADPHFGYHLLLVPFVKLFDPLVGIRIAGVLFAAAAVTMVVWILRRLDVRHAWVFGVILLLSEPFVFRMSLAKAPAISVLFLLIIWLLALKASHWRLFFLSFAYVWLYNAWPLAFVVVGAVTAADFIVRRKFDFRPLFFLTLGVAAGIIINPYFPSNLQFMWDFIVRSGIGVSHRLVELGGEWSAMKPWELAAGTPWVHVLMIGALVVAVRRRVRPSVPLLSATLLTAFFYVATIYARRNVEYFVPFAVIAGALATVSLFRDRGKVIHWFDWSSRRKSALGFTLAIVVALIVARDSVVIYETYRGGYHANRLRGATEWIKENVPPGEIIVHSNWSEFPMLFYYDDTHRYISGLDPTFFFFKDPARYRAWEDLRNGHITAGTAATIRDRFDAHYVLVTAHHEKMREAIKKDPRLTRVFHDEDAEIFEIEK